jgi:hypothetical protein
MTIPELLQVAELLPRDFVVDGKHLTQLFRSKTKGGANVYLQNSLPGEQVLGSQNRNRERD